jgi:hypothetical protein
VSVYSTRGLTHAVKGVAHLYRSEWDGFDEFTRGSGKLGVQAVKITVPEYLALLNSRFEMAKIVERKVFYGRSNDQDPSPWAFPVLADLANTLGVNFGEQ